MADRTFTGRCFCGAVEISVTGAPIAMGYCHCGFCRWWLAAPVSAFTLWKSVEVTRGQEHVAEYRKTDHACRRFCKLCGGHVMSEHLEIGLTDVYAAVIPDFPFEAKLHVNYESTVLPMRDGLPKFKGFPRPDGSGEMLPE